MGFFGMSMLGKAGRMLGSTGGRAVAGGAAGGAMGLANTGDMGGFLGGAAAGAGIGAFGGGLANRFAGGRTVAGMAQRGLGAGRRGVQRGRSAMSGLLSNSGMGNAAVGFGQAGMGGIGRGMNRLRGLVSRNSVAVNKWGGRALMGAGVASGAYIGSSMLGSNRGF